MEYIRNIFYRVVFTPNTPVNIAEETSKKINLDNYRIDFEKFDREVAAKCTQYMFYKYK
jgi:hypothetical protein